MTEAVVFVGPSLPRDDRAAWGRTWPAVEWRPPAAQGDAYAVARAGARAIGLVDGCFESCPAVWHKEILWALDQGVAVYGSSSMGALRAAELAPFGMVGVGAVFRYFQAPLRDDSDAALLHGPAELDYAALSEPHVNVHFTLLRAVAEGGIPAAVAAELREASKGIFYKDRSYQAILDAARARGVPLPALEAAAAWLAEGRVDQKRADVHALLRAMHDAARKPGWRAEGPRFEFQHTAMWDDARAGVEARVRPSGPGTLGDGRPGRP